jgi:hypothetical protein
MESLGLNENKCALVFNEKIGVMKQILDVIESMSCSSDLFAEDFFLGDGTGNKKISRIKAPDSTGCKKTTNSREPPR